MDLVDVMLQYRVTGNKGLLITSDLEIDKQNLNVIVVKILSWLKLEHKRSMWISDGRKTCLKPLLLDIQYPWCRGLYTLVEREPLFQNNFSIKNGRFDFSALVSEQDRIIIREKAYENYNPKKHT